MKNEQNIKVENSLIGTIQQTKNYFFGVQDLNLCNRRIIIDKVRLYWVEGVLKTSIYKNIYIDVYFDVHEIEDYKNNFRLWDINEDNILTQKNISNVLDNNENLLILGEPGSGKTTRLIKLCEALIERAENDVNHPIPIILNLSTYKKSQSLVAWLTQDLKNSYGIPKRITDDLIKRNELLFLLDGLDEVNQKVRDSCALAIQKFSDNTICPIIVCCRLNDYEQLGKKLTFHRRVIIKPLSQKQVKKYVHDICLTNGTPNKPYEIFDQNISLKSIITTPLMLSIFVSAVKDTLDDMNDPITLSSYQKHLLNVYLIKIFCQLPRCEFEQLLNYLRSISQVLIKESEFALTVENIQPSILNSKKNQYMYYLLAVFCSGIIPALVFFIIFIISYLLLQFSNGELYLIDKDIDLIDGMIFLSLIGIISSGRLNNIKIQRGLIITTERVWLLIKKLLFNIFYIVFFFSILFFMNSDTLFSHESIIVLCLMIFCFGGITALFALVISFIFTGHINSPFIMILNIFGSAVLTRGFLTYIYNKFWKSNSNIFQDILRVNLSYGAFVGIIYSIITSSESYIPSKTKVSSNRLTSLLFIFFWHSSVIAVLAVLAIFAIQVITELLVSGKISLNVPNMLAGIELGINLALVILSLHLIQLSKHLLLRLIAFRSGELPWNLYAFLDYCSERTMMRKVDYRYMFTHRLFTEHLANMNESELKDLVMQFNKKA